MLIVKQKALNFIRTAHVNPPLACMLCLNESIRIILGVIFVWSGLAKLMDPPQFAIIIESFGITPDPLALPIALCLSVVELLAGIALIFDVRGALSLVTAMLVLFMMILGYGIWIGLDVDCGCFGEQDPEAKAFHGLRPALNRDWFMLAAAVSLYWLRRQTGVRHPKLSAQPGEITNEGEITG